MANIAALNTATGQSLVQPAAFTWTGRIMSGIVVLFLLFDGSIKVLELPVVSQTLGQLGYTASFAQPLGLLTFACALLYAVPRTSTLGAILLTGLFGGAMATHLRVGSPITTHLLFGLYLGLLTWGGLFLRERRLRDLLPFRR